MSRCCCLFALLLVSWRVAYYPGSFDPPHIGHKALIDGCIDLGFDKVYIHPLPEGNGRSSLAKRLEKLSIFESEKVEIVTQDMRILRDQGVEVYGVYGGDVAYNYRYRLLMRINQKISWALVSQ